MLSILKFDAMNFDITVLALSYAKTSQVLHHEFVLLTPTKLEHWKTKLEHWNTKLERWNTKLEHQVGTGHF